MVTENARRWPVGLHGTPARFGKLLDYVSFDATFFAVHGKQASVRAPAPARSALSRTVAVLLLASPFHNQHMGCMSSLYVASLLEVLRL